jgi:hypothetical protein
MLLKNIAVFFTLLSSGDGPGRQWKYQLLREFRREVQESTVPEGSLRFLAFSASSAASFAQIAAAQIVCVRLDMHACMLCHEEWFFFLFKAVHHIALCFVLYVMFLRNNTSNNAYWLPGKAL